VKYTDDLMMLAREKVVQLVLNAMAHAQKPDFVFARNGRVHLNRWGASSSVDCWQPRCAHQLE